MGEAAGSADVGGAVRRVLPETEPNLLIPKRVRDALEGAQNFGEFRDRRPFVLLHLYCGPHDVLSEAITQEARANGLRTVTVSIDRKVDDRIDLEERGRECSSRPWMVSSTMHMEVSLAEAFHGCGGREIQGHLQSDQPRRSTGCRATRRPCKRRQIEEQEEQPTPQSWSRSTALLAGSVEFQNLGRWRIPLATKQVDPPGVCRS